MFRNTCRVANLPPVYDYWNDINRGLMTHSLGPSIEEDLPWDTLAAFSITPNTPWDILRA